MKSSNLTTANKPKIKATSTKAVFEAPSRKRLIARSLLEGLFS